MAQVPQTTLNTEHCIRTATLKPEEGQSSTAFISSEPEATIVESTNASLAASLALAGGKYSDVHAFPIEHGRL